MIRRGLSLGLTLLFALPAGAGTPTRIQLVGEIPSFVLETRDASGTISGEVDGIAADGLAGGSPQGVRVGAKLRLSIPEGAGVVAWGHLDGEGLFVEGLPGSGAEGHYRAATPGAASDRHFEPPVEFDLTGTSDAPQRTINLAVSVERPQGGDLVLSKSVVLVKPPVVLVHGINSGPTAWTGSSSWWRLRSAKSRASTATSGTTGRALPGSVAVTGSSTCAVTRAASASTRWLPVRAMSPLWTPAPRR